jgi:hypothetical protein
MGISYPPHKVTPEAARDNATRAPGLSGMLSWRPNGEGETAMAEIERTSVRTSAETYVIEAEAVRLGPDVLVYIWGGERPHIGAVAAAQPRPSLADPDKISATASVLTYVGHKEDLVAREVAQTLAALLNTNIVVTAGIHWDGLSADGVGIVVERCREITAKLGDALRGKVV